LFFQTLAKSGKWWLDIYTEKQRLDLKERRWLETKSARPGRVVLAYEYIDCICCLCVMMILKHISREREAPFLSSGPFFVGAILNAGTADIYANTTPCISSNLVENCFDYAQRIYKKNRLAQYIKKGGLDVDFRLSP